MSNPLTNDERQEIRNWANTQYAISYKYRDTDPKRAEFYYGRSVGMGKIAQVYNPLKSLGRISRKSQTLQKHYREEVKSKGYHENMGDKYMREFEKYVGDPYDYSYRDRLSLYGIRANLFNYVISPVQNPLSQKGNIAQRYNPSLKRFYKVNLNNGDVVMVFSERELVSLLARANIKSEYTSPFPKITGVRLATFPEIEWVKKSGEPVVRLNPLSRKKKNPIVEAAIYGLGLGAGLAVSNITVNKIAGKKNPLSSEVKTFKQWMNTFTEETMPYGVLAEDGYAFYLSQQLGRSPTIIEMKKNREDKKTSF